MPRGAGSRAAREPPAAAGGARMRGAVGGHGVRGGPCRRPRRGGVRGAPAAALPEGPGLPRPRPAAGRAGREADAGPREGLGLGPLAPCAHGAPGVAGPVGPGACPPPAQGAGRVGAAVPARPGALPADGRTPRGRGAPGGSVGRAPPSAPQGLEGRANGVRLGGPTRWGARVRRAHRGGGGGGQAGLHRRRERRQARGRGPARSPRSAGRWAPESATAHAATSPGRGRGSRRACHRDSAGMRWGSAYTALDQCGHRDGPPLSRDKPSLRADFSTFFR